MVNKNDTILFKTSRCLIRTFEEKDIDNFIEYRNNMEWMKHQGFKGLSKKEYREKLLVPFNIEKGSQLVIANKETDSLMGDLYVSKMSKVTYKQHLDAR